MPLDGLIRSAASKSKGRGPKQGANRRIERLALGDAMRQSTRSTRTEHGELLAE
jgi:hypothetical protein